MSNRRDTAYRMAHWDSHIPEPLVPARELKAGDVILCYGHESTIDSVRRGKASMTLTARGPAGRNGFSSGFELVVPKNNLVRVIRFVGEGS